MDLKRVLIVDDEAYTLMSLVRQTRRTPHQVDTANNGKEGLARIEAAEDPYDVLLTDFDMPVMSGLDLIHAIMQLPEEKRPRLIIAMTGDYGNLDVLKREAPAARTLEKPLTWHDVQRVMEDFFASNP